ncbi:MAG: hypothetical protein ACTSPT_03865 [Candidatus Heimdallarchaeota archaeon]
MAKSRVLLGAFLGSLIGVGLLALALFFANSTGISWLGLAIGAPGLAIGGFAAGLIATTPGKGALAGALTSVVTFIISGIIMVILVVGTGSALVGIIVGLATFGQTTVDIPPEALGLLIGVGLLVAGIIAIASATINAVTGFLGGLINNPKQSYAESYNEIPETR